MNNNNYRVGQYGNIFCVEVELKTQKIWSRVDVFGMPLDSRYMQALPIFYSLDEAITAIKQLPGEVPTPVYHYPEKM